MTERRVAAVTGGASGIGRGCAFRLAREGYGAAVVDIDAAGGERTAARIREEGGEAFFLEADIGEPDAFERIVRAVDERWGALHALVNNAGLDYHEPLSEMTAAAWDRCVAVDLRSAAFSAQAAADLMERSGGGSIVIVYYPERDYREHYKLPRHDDQGHPVHIHAGAFDPDARGLPCKIDLGRPYYEGRRRAGEAPGVLHPGGC